MLALVLLLLAGTNALQAPTVQIVFPTSEDYVTGTIVIKIAPSRPDAAIQVAIDGVPACTIKGAPFECRTSVGNELRRRVIRAVATFATGERAVHTVSTATLDVTAQSGVESVLASVSVRDSRDRFVPGLTREHFRLFDGGARREVSFFANEDRACELIVVMDVSSSMAGELPRVREAANALLAAVRPQDTVTLAAFNQDFFLLAPPTATPDARRRALGRLAAWGGTAIYDALLAAADHLAGRDRRRAIVVLTDGADQASHASIERVRERLLSDDVLLYFVGHGAIRRQAELRERMSELAEASGGRALFLSDAGEAADAFRDIVADLAQQYTLGFTPADGPEGWRPIKVEVDGRYRIRARQGYVRKRPGHP